MNNNLLAAVPAPPPQPGSSIGNPALGTKLQGILGSEGGVGFFSRLLPLIITLFLVIGSIIFFFIMLSGAIAWITSGGDKVSVENARNRLTHGLIGVVILFSIFAIIKVIEGIFGTSILLLDIGALNL